MKDKTKKWLKAAGIRAVRTMAQAASALIGVDKFITDVDWATVLSATLIAGILSVLFSVAGLPEVSQEEPEQKLPENSK